MNEKFQEATEIFLLNGFLVTQAQAAKIKGITPGRINQMISEGKITGVKILGTVMVRLSELKE